MQSVGNRNRHSGAPTGCRGCWAISLISLWIFASLTSSCQAERTNVGEFMAQRQNINQYILKMPYSKKKIPNNAARFYCASKPKRLRNENIRNPLVMPSATVCKCVDICEFNIATIVSECVLGGYFYAPTKRMAQKTVEEQHRFISCGEFGAFACFVWTLKT